MVVVDYSPQYGNDFVRMWRESFEQAVGVTDPHSFEDQLRYLEEQLVPNNRVRLVLTDNTSTVIGFLASSPRTISQLYVHVDHQNKGVGSMLLSLAKQDSNGSLSLFTFDCNRRAQQFYEKHGFKIVGRGFEKNWQLDDIEYEWLATLGDRADDSNRRSQS